MISLGFFCLIYGLGWDNVYHLFGKHRLFKGVLLLKVCCFLGESKKNGTKIRCSVNGKPVSNSDAQKVLIQGAARMMVEKVRRLERYAQKNKEPCGFSKQ